mmetsp:Transcript_42839/g.134391  ORF Transcript_42839/g.134391 Transcript_42839/m.134391 type:complete len:161 (-) Transcript_42839:1371-1853(-)
MSKSLPFLEKPEKLDGSMIGDVGFDPMGLSNQGDLTYMRAAEIKHGRVAMLATVGFFVANFMHIPGMAGKAGNPFDALSEVPLAAHLQVLFLIGTIEFIHLNKTFTSDEPWDLGWGSDRLNSMTKEKADELKLKELKNGRLAMIATVGMAVQTALFGKLF